MLRLLSIAALPLLIAGQEFQCGTDKIQADIAKTVVQFNCKDKVSDINSCCIAHDGCYDKQQPRATCDASFCTCVAAASAGNPLCGFYTSIFCDTAKVFGEAAYKKVGEERKKRREREAATSTTVPPTTVPTTKATVPATTATVPKVLADPKVGGESRHKEDKLPGDKSKSLLRKTETPPKPTVVSTTEAPVLTSSEEDREVADLEARLAREEADLEREEAAQRRVLEKLAERKAQLRADLQRFRESQRRLWKAKEEETVAAVSEDTTLTPSTTVVTEEPTTTTTVAPPPSTTTVSEAMVQQRLKRREEARRRREERKRLHEEHRARVLAAKTLRLAARTSTTTTTTTEAPEAEEDEPKVTVTSELLEGSGEAITVAAAWSDDDLIPEAE